VTPLTETDYAQRRSLLLLWLGLLTAPLGWFLCLQVNYMLVPWICATGQQWTLSVTTFVGLLLAASSGVVAWRMWQRAGPEWPSEAGGMIPRSRFMAVLGMLMSSLFFLVILAQGIPSVILHACQS